MAPLKNSVDLKDGAERHLATNDAVIREEDDVKKTDDLDRNANIKL